jgi:hypothetical protein
MRQLPATDCYQCSIVFFFVLSRKKSVLHTRSLTHCPRERILWPSTYHLLSTMMGRALLLIVALAVFALSAEVCMVIG